MKKTEYFTSPNSTMQQIEIAIDAAKQKRDSWLERNKNSIAKVDREDIKMSIWNANNQHVFVTILLTYYPKL